MKQPQQNESNSIQSGENNIMQYTAEELQKILDEHKKWISDEGGKRADLSNADLSNAKLSGAKLTHADLSYANLICADLSNAKLYGAYLTDSDLSHANLSNADLGCANLSRANLTNSDLFDADLFQATWSKATFDNTLIFGEPVNKAPVQLHDYRYYFVLITDTMMKIGCQVHSIDEWLAFTVEEIENMDRNAKEFYTNYRKLIQAAVLSHRVPKEENKES